MRTDTFLTYSLAALLAFSCASCCVFAPRKMSPAENITPDAFAGHAGVAAVPDCWWTNFQSQELNGLIKAGLGGNLSIAQAQARLEQAAASAVKGGAARIPALSLKAGGSVTELDEATIDGGDTHLESAEAGLAASYEIDLWGRTHATAKGAAHERDAAKHDLQTAKISVAAEITVRYLELLSVREKISLVENQLHTDKTILDLIRYRFHRSQATALDILQQREKAAQTKALLPLLHVREGVLLNQLAVLTGQPPGKIPGLKSDHLPDLPDLPAAGLPAQLLQKRPDLQAAAERLEAARWKAGAATADRLPSISISASAGYSSDELSNILDSWSTRLAANLLGPIIDGGSRRAEAARTKAVVTEQLAAYRQLVLGALKEVEDALITEAHQAEYVEALGKRREAADATRAEAMFRYRNGDEAFLSVLLSARSVQAIDRTLVDARFDRLSYRVSLYRALAGGWDNTDDSDIK